MQYRLSTLLLAFVVVWSSLAVFGMEWGIAVATFLLAAAAYFRSPAVRSIPLSGLFLVIFLLGLILPTLVSRRDSPAFPCKSNLNEIGLALLAYEQAGGGLPPAVVVDEQTKAAHSWRMLITPQLECISLYNECNFREPWNGPNNSKLAAQVPPSFSCRFDPWIHGRPLTSYLAVTGPGTVWDDHRSAGTPPRLMVVEVENSKINWMEPRDLTIEQACHGAGDRSRMCISSYHHIPGGFFFQDEVAGSYAVFSDGAVRFIPVGLPSETLKGLFTGDEKAWHAYEEFRRPRIHWANCTALAVLIISCAVLLFRRRDRPLPAAAAGTGGEECRFFSRRSHRP